MAQLYSAETAGYASNPIIKPATPAYGGRIRRYRATITLASQANADWILLARIPAGSIFDFGMITATVSLATSVVAIGTSPTHGTNGQYRAAAVYTAVDTPTLFGTTAAQAGSALTADTLVYLTSATAALPASGTLVVDLYFNAP
jgi:hypothetical protein